MHVRFGQFSPGSRRLLGPVHCSQLDDLAAGSLEECGRIAGSLQCPVAPTSSGLHSEATPTRRINVFFSIDMLSTPSGTLSTPQSFAPRLPREYPGRWRPGVKNKTVGRTKHLDGPPHVLANSLAVAGSQAQRVHAADHGHAVAEQLSRLLQRDAIQQRIDEVEHGHARVGQSGPSRSTPVVMT